MKYRSKKSILKHRLYMRAYYHQNKETCRRRMKIYLREKSKKLRALKDRPCMDCNKFYPYWVMDFDHKRNKKFCIGRAVANKSWKDILKEIKKCDLVCANCHRTRTFKRSVR